MGREENRDYPYQHQKLSREDRNALRMKRKGNKGKGGKNHGHQDGPKNFPDSIHGIPIVEQTFSIPPMGERKRKRKQFKAIRNEFLRYVGKNCQEELVAMGLKPDQVDMVKGGRTPNGFNVHHKLPIHGGGKNEFSNFILMPIPPHDDLHHKIIDPQVKYMKEGDSKTIKIPMPREMVYVPENRRHMLTREQQIAPEGMTGQPGNENNSDSRDRKNPTQARKIEGSGKSKAEMDMKLKKALMKKGRN